MEKTPNSHSPLGKNSVSAKSNTEVQCCFVTAQLVCPPPELLLKGFFFTIATL